MHNVQMATIAVATIAETFFVDRQSESQKMTAFIVLLVASALALACVSAYKPGASSSFVPRSPKEIAQRRAGNVIAGTFASLVATKITAANAGWPFSAEEQDKLDAIQAFQRPVYELFDQLRPTNIPNPIGVYSNTQFLKGNKEDSDVVLSYVSVYIDPCQKAMEALAPKLQLAEEDQKNIVIQSKLMKGHIAELNQAIVALSAKDQAREVQEVMETLAEYLRLASTKYAVKPFIPSRPLTDAELFGPLGCEFWGKKRAEGSNACVEIEKPAV